jgi:hypothetical protein
MKAQANIVAAVIIIVLAIALVSAAYTWGVPLIMKRQDWALVDRVRNSFDQNNINSLPSKIEYIATNRGEDTFISETNGIFELNETENSITFSFFSRVSDIAINSGWISLTYGSSCPPSDGYVGIDKASVVCARADTHQNGYNITYRIYFRKLFEPAGTKGYKIQLVKHEASQLKVSGRNVKIIYSGTEETLEGGKTIIVTKIKILLG